MAEQFANNASTTLNGGINNSVTSVVVTDGSVFPSSGNFRIVCGSEIMLVTARSSNTLTVTRGQEGSTASSHASGDSVSHVYTKGSLEQLISDYDQVGGYASRPSSDLRKAQLYSADDLNAKWVYNGTNWDLVWPTYVPYARRYVPGSWTALNQSTATFTDKNGILQVSTIPATASTVRGITKSLPSSPYTLTAIIDWSNFSTASHSWYIGHRESGTGKLTLMYNTANVGGTVGVEFWNSATSFASSQSGPFRAHGGRARFPRVENDGTNWNYYTSYDGKNWTKFFSHTKNSGMTTAADQVFLGILVSTAFTSISGGTDTPAMNLLGYWEA